MAKTIQRDVRIAGQRYVLRSVDVKHAVRNVDPEPITSHFVVIGRRRYPPKQVISAVTGLDRADFTTHQARRTLMGLGFQAGRRRASLAPGERALPADPRAPLVQRLRPLVGQWVAIKDDDVLHDAKTPQQLIAWLSEHKQTADTVFRVPEDELATTGLAPQ